MGVAGDGLFSAVDFSSITTEEEGGDDDDEAEGDGVSFSFERGIVLLSSFDECFGVIEEGGGVGGGLLTIEGIGTGEGTGDGDESLGVEVNLFLLRIVGGEIGVGSFNNANNCSSLLTVLLGVD